MTTTLRMLLAAADCDPGLVEVTPFQNKRESENESRRETDPTTGAVTERDLVTGEAMREWIRGVLSIRLTFVASGPQTSSFDDVDAWVVDYFKRTHGRGLLDVTIREVEE